MKRTKYTMRDRRRERGDVIGYSLNAMATRMFGRRCSVMRSPGSDTGTVIIRGGQVIGEVAIFEE
jgi:hypothetical protein